MPGGAHRIPAPVDAGSNTYRPSLVTPVAIRPAPKHAPNASPEASRQRRANSGFERRSARWSGRDGDQRPVPGCRPLRIGSGAPSPLAPAGPAMRTSVASSGGRTGLLPGLRGDRRLDPVGGHRPRDIEPVGPFPAIEIVAHRAVEVGQVPVGDGPEPLEIEPSVPEQQRVEGPPDLSEFVIQGPGALRELQGEPDAAAASPPGDDREHVECTCGPPATPTNPRT